MKKRGRKPLRCRVVPIRLHFNLREGEDDDLIEFFNQFPGRGERVNALKVALRTGDGMRLPFAEESNCTSDLKDMAKNLFA